MNRTRPDVVLAHVRALLDGSTADGLSDAELVQHFLDRRDEAAFAALVRRHGPLVWGVCRRNLANAHDAEDVFQATFLVLARKAGSVRKTASLGSWLYGVAHRLACKARNRAARDRTGPPPPPAPDAFDDVTVRELRTVLDEELARLPEGDRAAVLLCYFEGLTHEEAAHRLGWNKRHVKARLDRARRVLRARLTRRGVELGVTLLSLSVTSDLRAAVPASLASCGVRTALRFAAGEAPGTVAARAVALAQGELNAMHLTRLSVAASLALVAGLALFGLSRSPADPPPAAPARPPAVDLFGEPLPAGALARLGSLNLRHGSPTTGVVFSPNGKLLASSSWDNTLGLWDAATSKLVRRISPQAGWTLCVAFSPDNKLVAVGANKRGGCVTLWDVETGKEVRRLLGHGDDVTSVVFAPDGKTLVSACLDGCVRFWDVSSGEERRTLRTHAARAAAFSADGKRLATAGTDTLVRVWDAAGKELLSLNGHDNSVTGVAWSPDGKSLASAGQDGTVRLWDVTAGEERRVIKQGQPLAAVAFSPDGKFLAAAAGDFNNPWQHKQPGSVRIWEAATGKDVHVFRDRVSAAMSVAFSPDGNTVAAADRHSALLLWDTATGKPRGSQETHFGCVKSVAFTPDGGTVLTAGRDRTVRAWDAAKGTHLRRFDTDEAIDSALAMSPDGRLTASGGLDGVITLWETATGKPAGKLGEPGPPAYALAFAPDGKTLAAGCVDRLVRIWDVGRGKLVQTLRGHGNYLTSLAYSPDGRLLASGSADRTVRLWNPDTGAEMRKLEGHTFQTTNLAFSPDGRTLASASRDESVRLWEVATGQLRWRYGDVPQGCATVAFSPDGRLLLTGSSEGKRGVRLWDQATGEELCRVWDHRGYVVAVAYAPDGRKVATAGDEGTVLVWDVNALVPGLPRPPAPDAKAAWAALLDIDAEKAYRAVWSLAASPKESLTMLRQHLKPATVDGKRVAALVADLDSDDFAVREKATAELERLGEAAEARLRQARDAAGSAEVRRRLDVLLEKLRTNEPSGERLRTLRALEALELAATKEASALLKELADGEEEAWLTREASASLRRLSRRR